MQKNVFFVKKVSKSSLYNIIFIHIMSFYLYFCSALTRVLNIGGELSELSLPLVMAIVNATDDSFYAASRCMSSDDIRKRAEQAIADGADIIDIGACSTRPNSVPVDEDTEWKNLRTALSVVRKHLPEVLLSVDTFRAGIARRAVSEFGPMIINDVSGMSDVMMADVLCEYNVPYVLTYCGESEAETEEQYMSDSIDWLQKKKNTLYQAGVTDIIIDPGFGFNKTYAQNWFLLKNLNCLEIFGKPVLVGVSRKSMLQKMFGTTAEGLLNATTATHMVALQKGADILRVHDVKEAKEAITIYMQTK